MPSALKIFLEYPFFGIGLNSYPLYSAAELNSAHNFILTIIVELGLVIGIPLLLLLLLFWSKFYPRWVVISIFTFGFISGLTILQLVGMTSAFNLLHIQVLLQSRNKISS